MRTRPNDRLEYFGGASKLGFLLKLQRAGTQTKALPFIHESSEQPFNSHFTDEETEAERGLGTCLR